MAFRRKLPRSSFILLCVSVSCAVAAGLVMQAYAHRLDTTRPDGGPPLAVVAATIRVPRGTILSETALEMVTLPARFAPPGALRDVARAAGRIAVTDIAAGEVVTDLRLAGARSGPTAAVVPAGMRAVGVPVASSVGVKPGDLVDVIATFGGGGAHTEVTGEALEVLAVDRAGGGAAFGGATTPGSGGVGLVLLVSPANAERLAFASAFATLSIAVRGPDDLVTTTAFGVPPSTDR
jgi:Flp pilus assembly protein CpaB